MSAEKRRAEYDIYADIVVTVAKKDICSLTRISYGANLPVDRAKKFVQLLVSHGFIRESVVDTHVKYRATKRGLEYVETYKRMKKFFAALEEPVAVEMPELAQTVLPGRIKTGYKGLDTLLFGGIPAKYAVVLTSPSCDERDLLLKKFLRTGVDEKQVTFYITTDVARSALLARELRSNFYLFVCNPQADSILKTSPTIFKTKGVENLTDINIILNSAFTTLGSITKQPRVCIDLISDVLLQHRAVTTRRWLAALIPELKAKGFTILGVVTPYMHSPEEVQAVIGLFDGELDFYEKTEDDRKFLRIKKLFGQRYQNNPISITKEELEKTEM